ncbi:MAG: hypothetical protein ACOZJX_10295 [Pseudomonadota bacterium]
MGFEAARWGERGLSHCFVESGPLSIARLHSLKTSANAASHETPKRANARTAKPVAESAAQAAPAKRTFQTLLVASCGWPTDAELPTKRTARR